MRSPSAPPEFTEPWPGSSADAAAGARHHPVVELFGPTIQGEGPDCGTPAHFVRFGGCDYRCSWCDSMHAVDPGTVRRTGVALSAAQIVERITELGGSARLVVLTGGNPALHELGSLVRLLHAAGRSVSVETQGTVFRAWLHEVDRLVISPKPPSAGVDHVQGRRAFDRFLGAAGLSPSVAIKVVVFDEADLRFAAAIAADHPEAALYLSAGTPVGLSDGMTREQVIERTRWLVEMVGSTTVLGHARVLPQLHVMLWGTKLGV